MKPTLGPKTGGATRAARFGQRALRVLLLANDRSDERALHAAMASEILIRDVVVARDPDELLATLTSPDVDIVYISLAAEVEDTVDMITAIKTAPGTATVPAVVMSPSGDPTTTHRLYQQGANTVLRKSENPADYVAAVRASFHFWTNVAIVPPRVA